VLLRHPCELRTSNAPSAVAAAAAATATTVQCCPGGKGFGDPVTFDNAYYSALLAKPWLNPNDSMATMIGGLQVLANINL
jgi:hypothetical protein